MLRSRLHKVILLGSRKSKQKQRKEKDLEVSVFRSSPVKSMLAVMTACAMFHSTGKRLILYATL